LAPVGGMTGGAHLEPRGGCDAVDLVHHATGMSRASDATSNYCNGPHNGWKYAGYGYHVPTAVKNHIDAGGTVYHGSGGTRSSPRGTRRSQTAWVAISACGPRATRRPYFVD